MMKYFFEILVELSLCSLIFSKLFLNDKVLILLLIVANKNSNEYPFFWRILIRKIIFFSWNLGKRIWFCLTVRLQYSFCVLKDDLKRKESSTKISRLLIIVKIIPPSFINSFTLRKFILPSSPVNLILSWLILSKIKGTYVLIWSFEAAIIISNNRMEYVWLES